MKLQGHKEVDRALAQALKEVDKALTALNRQAAGLVAKGSYEAAEEMLASGRAISEFRARVAGVRDEWRKLREASQGESGESTPMWKYYRPILQVLVELGGEAKRDALEERLFDMMQSEFQPADLVLMARGVPRWKVMVRRSRRAMVQESYIENGSGPWRITSAGKQAARSPTEVG